MLPSYLSLSDDNLVDISESHQCENVISVSLRDDIFTKVSGCYLSLRDDN